MADNFSTYAKGLEAPADTHFAITPSDSADLAVIPRAIYAGTDGNVAIRDKAGTDITYAVTAGQILPFRAVRVLATGTTATVVGLY